MEDISEEALALMKKVAVKIENMSDLELETFVNSGGIEIFLTSLLDSQKLVEHKTIAEFLMNNKLRSSLIAKMKDVITQRYSFRVESEGRVTFVSPTKMQWYSDGVMFIEGEKPFEGLLGLYKNDKSLSYAIMAREVQKGEPIGKEDMAFIDVDFIKKQKFPETISEIEKPLHELKKMLERRISEESKYQEYFEAYPWVLGTNYVKIERHTRFDDRGIPDFTCLRAKDVKRDIIEIKQPFLKLFTKDGNLSSDFNNAWNQIERYYHFAVDNKGYLLQEKGLDFENPKCLLFLGKDLEPQQIKIFKQKEKSNPWVEIYTYDDLLVLISNTIGYIKRHSQK